ncbi:polysaccharide biosynthesis tyrosine autokinase [Butyrivibrio sp. MC2013]|uniref:polysaccharide biosynthesis tyrosine autokinase n=1 Tax=Butyrivibrio sp. MC2013 TaxID=1280686 RepID=UPI000423F3B9|nr:polysaccharide biosynthesis tyrosine autokinase [Butyrivibrio sp. MC2013]
MFETIVYNLNFARIIDILKRHLAVIIIAFCLGGIAGGTYAALTGTPTYLASVSFYVYSNPDYINDTSVNISSSDVNAAKNLIDSYMMVLKSDSVLNTIIDNLELNMSSRQLNGMISSRAVEGTAVFYVYVTDLNPYEAMEIANGIAEVAPEAITRIVKSGGIEVIDNAVLPTAPYQSVSMIKYTLLGAVGLGGLILVIFLISGLLDPTIRRKYEVTNTFNIPILGDVPQNKSGVGDILSTDSSFVIRESYNLLRTNMLFTNQGSECPVVAFTSAFRGEGKTLSSVNVAISFAELGKKILLIDADMRYPSVERIIAVDNDEKGLSDYLGGLTKELPVVDTQYEGLYVVKAGTVPPNPSELLANKKFSDMLIDQKANYDYIFIDLPPIGVVSDASMIINDVDSYAFVVRANYSKLGLTKQAVEMLGNIGAKICGFIYNGVAPDSEDYRYKYIHSYDANGNRIDGKGKKKKKK